MPSKVHIYKCPGYNKNKIKEIISSYFRNTEFTGKNILLKPNMLQAHCPERNVTTNPVIVEAAAEVVMEKGASCRIGDSPSGRGMANAEAAAEKTGFLEVCRRLGIDFDFFDNQDLQEVRIKDGKVYNKVYLPKSYFSYDIIINLPKLKTHALTVFTLGVKNMFGLLPGLAKSDFHRKAAHPKKFAAALCDLYSVVIPDFTILDGIEGMDGEGPVTGRTKKLNRIFISSDTNALDAVVESMCGVDPKKVLLTREVADRGLGGFDNITIEKYYSTSDEDEKFNGFKTSLIPVLGERVPVWAVEILSPIMLRKPVADNNLCISCGKCTQICPVDAINMLNGYPYFDMKKCIKCFCCAERCSESAITEKRNPLVNLIRSIKRK